MGQVFDPIADQYDRWYDTLEGDAIFRAERDCLLSLYDGPFDGWVDVSGTLDPLFFHLCPAMSE